MTNRKQLKSRDRTDIYNRFNGKCAYCGCEIAYKDMQVDHVKPLHIGGKDCMSNMMPACRSCNHYKSTLTVESFRKALMRMPDVLIRDNVTFKIALRFGIVGVNREPIVFYFERYDQLPTPPTFTATTLDGKEITGETRDKLFKVLDSTIDRFLEGEDDHP